MTDKDHWENIYTSKSAKEVSWYAPHLEKSLELILDLNLPKDSAIIDIGGGASTLPDDLLSHGFNNVTVMDISAKALQAAKDRIGAKSKQITWLEADVTTADLKSTYHLWHDRAVFHFLTDPADRKRYLHTLKNSLIPKGYVLMATFGPNGPLKCSGLEIVRYSPENLHEQFGGDFKMIKQFTEIHKTPFHTEQEFIYCLFKKTI